MFKVNKSALLLARWANKQEDSLVQSLTNKRSIFIIAASVLFVAYSVLAAPLLVVAQDQGGQQQENGNGLRITPPRIQDVVNQGEKKEYTINVRNITTTPVTAVSEVNDFITENEGNDPKLITDPEFESPYTLKDKLSTIEDFNLDPGEDLDVNVTLTIREDQTPGAYYGLVRFTAIPQDIKDKSGFALSASVGTIMLIQVPGEVVESMSLVELAAAKDEADASQGRTSSFFMSAPSHIVTRLRNEGNAFLQPFGRVSVKDMSGNEVAQFELNNTEPRGNVLPDSTRRFVNEIEGIGSFGKYTIETNISYGEGGGNIITSSSTFWVVPLPALIGIAVVLLAAIGLVVFGIRRVQRNR